MKRMISICLALVLLLATIPFASSTAISQYGYVTGGWLRLRSSASFDASTINSYYTGTQVKILSSTSNWYQVETPDGNTGYMYASYISFSGGGTGTSYVTSSNGYGVRMRSGPGTGYRSIGVYSVGTAVTVLQAGTYWSKIQINSTVVYMMNKFLTSCGGGGGTGDSATVWSANGYGVRLRSGPGTGYNIIGVYSVGTLVSVITHGDVWDYISVGSRSGYMMNTYLHYNSTRTVTAVTLNNTTPVVGSEMSVASLTPSDATVDYAWYSGADKVATTSTYTVLSSDQNRQIKLIVTGKGDYTGSATSALTSPVAVGQDITSAALNNDSPVVGDVLKVVSIKPSGAQVACQWYSDGTLVGTKSSYTVAESDTGKIIKVTVTGTGLYTGSYTVTAANAVQSTGVVTGLKWINSTNNSDAGITAPNVNDVLVAAPEPATATVTYKWVYADDTSTLLGTGNTLKITSSMLSHKIQLTITGTGKYSGNYTNSTGDVVNKTNITEVTLNTFNPRYDPDIADNRMTATVKAGTTEVSESCDYKWYRGLTVVGTNSRYYSLTPEDRGFVITVKATAKTTSTYSGTKQLATTSVVRQRLAKVTIGGGTSSIPGHVSVGDVLTPVLDSGSVTPNNLNVTCTWTLNGQTANTLSYTVPNGSVAGKELTLTVSAKGDFYILDPITEKTTLTANAIVDATAMTITLPTSNPVAGKPYAVTVSPTGALATYTWTGGNGGSYSGASITVNSVDIGKTIHMKAVPAAGYAGVASNLEQDTLTVNPQAITATLIGDFEAGGQISVVTTPSDATISSVEWVLVGVRTMAVTTGRTYTLPADSKAGTVHAVVHGAGNFNTATATTEDRPIWDGVTDRAIVIGAPKGYIAPVEGSSLDSAEPTATNSAESTDAVATETVSAEPTATDAIVTEPVSTDGTVTEPVSTDGTVSEPPVTDAAPTEPSNNDQTITEPANTDSVITEPTSDASKDATSTDSSGTDTQPYTVELTKTDSTYRANTLLTAVVGGPVSVKSYAWYINTKLLEDVIGDRYTITQANIDAGVKITLIVTYDDDHQEQTYIQLPKPAVTSTTENTSLQTEAPVSEEPLPTDNSTNTEPVITE